MKSSDEIGLIKEWVELVHSRRELIGRTKEAQTGEEFSTCGDLELDSRVAAILLNAIQNRLPNYRIVYSDRQVRMGRTPDAVRARSLQLLPSLLFVIDWASTAPGVSWPEAYFVTYVPLINLRIVTASRDDPEIWGHCDLAIGYCRAVRTPEFGVKKIIQSWWGRASGTPPIPWEVFSQAGLIDQRRAERWRKEVFGSTKDIW